MTDRLTPATYTRAPSIELRAPSNGRARLVAVLRADGRYLEIAERGRVTIFDLALSVAAGVCVLVEVEGDD